METRRDIEKRKQVSIHNFWYSTQIQWFHTNLWLCLPRFFGGYREIMLSCVVHSGPIFEALNSKTSSVPADFWLACWILCVRNMFTD